MAEQKESYWSKHHWAIFQCALAVYCAVLGTLEYLRNTYPQPTSSVALQPSGKAVVMTPPEYHMPLYLWLGIIALCLSVAIPAVIKMFQGRTVAKPHNTPQNLREQLATLAGNLCGYLIAHGRELNPPDDPSTNGFEVIPEEPDIIATFEWEFREQLMAVRTGLGNVGLLLGDTGEILEDGALHADDVRRIIDRLVHSIGLLDSRCNTKAPPL